MEEILNELKKKPTPPTREDIARLLASIGAPGEELEKKEEALRQLFEGRRNVNFQGFGLDLTDYQEY